MRISGQDVFGLLGSLCNLYRIHFYPKRIAQSFSPPHSLATPLFTLVIIAKVVVLKTRGTLILLGITLVMFMLFITHQIPGGLQLDELFELGANTTRQMAVVEKEK